MRDIIYAVIAAISVLVTLQSAEAVKTAADTLRDLRVAEVVKQDIHLDEGGAITYRAKLQLSFKYEHER